MIASLFINEVKALRLGSHPIDEVQKTGNTLEASLLSRNLEEIDKSLDSYIFALCRNIDCDKINPIYTNLKSIEKYFDLNYKARLIQLQADIALRNHQFDTAQSFYSEIIDIRIEQEDYENLMITYIKLSLISYGAGNDEIALKKIRQAKKYMLLNGQSKDVMIQYYELFYSYIIQPSLVKFRKINKFAKSANNELSLRVALWIYYELAKKFIKKEQFIKAKKMIDTYKCIYQHPLSCNYISDAIGLLYLELFFFYKKNKYRKAIEHFNTYPENMRLDKINGKLSDDIYDIIYKCYGKLGDRTRKNEFADRCKSIQSRYNLNTEKNEYLRNLINSDSYNNSSSVSMKETHTEPKPIDAKVLCNVYRIIISEIENNYMNEQFSVADACIHLNISKSTLYRLMKKAELISFNSLLKDFRLKKAKEILNSENVSIKELSYRVGFSSQSYFTKCFKEAFQVLPHSLTSAF